MKRVSLIAAALFAWIITAGVAAQEPAYPPPACASCGVVTSVRYVEPKGDGSGAGAIVGGSSVAYWATSSVPAAAIPRRRLPASASAPTPATKWKRMRRKTPTT
jgi:hypothetical protein